MDRIKFGYTYEGTEAFPRRTVEGRLYIDDPEILESSGQVSDELMSLTRLEMIAQAKVWRNKAKMVLTDCQDAVLIAELCADRETRAGACAVILESIAEIVDYNLDYALDVLYRRCNVYGECSPDFIRIRHNISEDDNIDMMSCIDDFIESVFSIAKQRADIAVM